MDKLDALLKRFETQAELAKALKVDQATISRWLAGKVPPEGFVKLSNVAAPEDRLWFLQQAGVEVDQLLLAAAEELKLTPSESVAPLLRNLPGNAKVFPVPEGMAGPFPPGNVFIIEPATDPQDPWPFWDQIVLLEFPQRDKRPEGWMAATWPTGLFVGRLCHKPYFAHKLSFFATIGADLNDSADNWGPRDLAFVIGSWSHPEPSPTPAEAAEIERLRKKSDEVHADYKKLHNRHDAISHSEFAKIPEAKRLGELSSELSLELTLANNAPLVRTIEEAKMQAPEMMKLAGVRILGRVIAWFAAPRESR